MEYLATFFLICTTGPGLAGLIPLGIALVFGEEAVLAAMSAVAGAAILEDWICNHE